MANVTEALSREHEVVLKELDRFDRALERFDLDGIRETLRFFVEGLPVHRRKEEEVLFPELGKHIGTEIGPIACMLEEHADEKEKVEFLRRALESGEPARVRSEIVAAGRYIVTLLRNHIFKEDHVLFPLAEATLNVEEKRRVKEGMDGIGYCCGACGHAA